MTSIQPPRFKRHLPSGYVSIDDVLSGRVAEGKVVSLIGLVRDHQTPIATRGNDYKCTYTIYDNSVEDSQLGLVFTMFGREHDMPQPSAGDVLVIISAKVQTWRGSVSLISNHSMSIHLYSAVHIPLPPRSAKGALRSSYGPRKPSDREHEYVSWLWHHINKDSVPDASTFQRRVSQSGRMKDKFCKLEDAVNAKFCDVIVNVVKAPYYELEKTTLWVSDYTENDYFYKFSWGERDGNHTDSKWAGPYGKRSMQITCFEPHASQVESEVQLGQWIHIRNLRIKMANNGMNLEGVLHGERDSILSHFEVGRSLVHVLNCENGSTCDSRLKEAIQRKVNYEKLMKQELKSLEADDTSHTKPATSERARRRQERRAAKKKVEEQDKRAADKLGLNDLIKCESPDQPITPVSSITKPVYWKTTVDGEPATLLLPFTCAKYRTYARIVDFRPRSLENFATWHKTPEYDMLSDYDSSSGSESDGDDEHNTLGQDPRRKSWEWRFVLQLEDVNPNQKGEKERVWAIVDNVEAQQLTGMDACDLRTEPGALHALREQLFKLWGNLEESKLHEQQRQIKNQRRVEANQPPPSSPTNGSTPDQQQAMTGEENGDRHGPSLSNKPFACCIRQYGVRVPESDPLRTNAGDGFRWVRVFGLYGTRIAG